MFIFISIYKLGVDSFLRSRSWYLFIRMCHPVSCNKIQGSQMWFLLRQRALSARRSLCADVTTWWLCLFFSIGFSEFRGKTTLTTHKRIISNKINTLTTPMPSHYMMESCVFPSPFARFLPGEPLSQAMERQASVGDEAVRYSDPDLTTQEAPSGSVWMPWTSPVLTI